MNRELLDKVQCYLNGRCTLRDLETWLLSRLQGILDAGDRTAINIANQLDADLVQVGEGLIDTKTLQEHLQSYVSSEETIVLREAEWRENATVATAAVETIRRQAVVLVPVVDLHLAHRFA